MAGRPLAAALTGALVGLVAGIAFDAAVWLWAFSSALGGDVGAGLPLVVRTDLEHGDVVAQSGVGILAVPAACVVAGVLVGLVVVRLRSTDVDTTARDR